MTILLTSTYSQADCKIGVVHVGLGAFHRAHQAYYFDAMMEKTNNLSWGIAATNLRAADSGAFSKMQKDGGYVLKTMANDGTTECRLIRSHLAYEDWSVDSKAAENLLTNADVQLLTITVTESGYFLNEGGGLNSADEVLKAEVAGGPQVTIYGYLRAALNRRRVLDIGSITVLCCDNLRHNGTLLKQNFNRYLDLCGDKELLVWSGDYVTFPCTMVDRITPKPTSQTFEFVAREFGRENDASVLAEDFIQWVIEDAFAGKKPPLDAVGVQYVSTVDPYEETKIRILNGGHTGLAYFGALAGYTTFDQIMADPKFLKHLSDFQYKEVLPALGDDMPIDLEAYVETTKNRFQNTNIADTVERICMDGVSKFPVFILPTITRCFEIGITPVLGIRSIASWFVFAMRIADGSMAFDYADPRYEVIAQYVENGDSEGFANSEAMWGDLPARVPEFSRQLIREIYEIESHYPCHTADLNHVISTK